MGEWDWQSDVSRFIGARLDEDELWALEASRDSDDFVPTGAHWQWVETEDDHVLTPDPGVSEFLDVSDGASLRSVEEFPTSLVCDLPMFAIHDVDEIRSAVAGHIARWDPARVLAEIAVKREITSAHDGEHYCMPAPDGSTYWNHDAGWAEGENHPQTCPIHRMYAALYRDHPDYRQEWAP